MHTKVATFELLTFRYVSYAKLYMYNKPSKTCFSIDLLVVRIEKSQTEPYLNDKTLLTICFGIYNYNDA